MTRRERGTGRIYKQRGCALWTIQYYKNGRRIREATGTADFQAARQKLRQRLQQISTGTYVGANVERIRVAELAEPFFRDQRVNGRKRINVPEARWKNHLQPFFADMRVVDVGTDALNQYVDQRMHEGAKNATINREIAVLRRMFRLGYYANPLKVARLPKFPKLKEENVRCGFVEPHQYDALIAAADGLWLRAMLEVHQIYGWRKREVMSMKVRQVDFAAGVIRLDVGSTKNKEGREVAMTEKVRSLLAECARGKAQDDALFTRSNGKPVRDFRDAWRNLCIAAGIGQMVCLLCEKVVTGSKCECGSRRFKYVGPILHDLRRTAARNLRRAGVSEGVIMKIGGWKTRSVFERYNIVDKRDIQEALSKLERARQDEFGHKVGHNQAQGGSDDGSPETTTVN